MNLNKQILISLKEAVLKPLNQSSLNRVLNHINDRAFCLLTAFRGDNSKAENIKQNKKLAFNLKNSHWGFIKVNGKFVETDHNDGKKRFSSEDTYLVVGPKLDNKEGCNDFKSEMIMLGRTYNQQSVIIGNADGIKEYDKVGNTVTTFKNKPILITDKELENFMTELTSSGKHAFKFDSIQNTEEHLKNNE